MNLSEIKNQLPHGALTEISKRTGISVPNISIFFNQKKSFGKKTKIKILNAAAKYLKEITAKENAAMEQFEHIN